MNDKIVAKKLNHGDGVYCLSKQDAGEVPLGAWMRFKHNPQDRVLIGWVSVQADRDLWLEEREHSTDGGLTWKPCGVEEVGK